MGTNGSIPRVLKLRFGNTLEKLSRPKRYKSSYGLDKTEKG